MDEGKDDRDLRESAFIGKDTVFFIKTNKKQIIPFDKTTCVYWNTWIGLIRCQCFDLFYSKNYLTKTNPIGNLFFTNKKILSMGYYKPD